jgi:hypothetical protein
VTKLQIEDIYGDLPQLETERLILRKISLEDINDMHNYAPTLRYQNMSSGEHMKQGRRLRNMLK